MNIRKAIDYSALYAELDALMAEAMKVGWTQNVLIMERCVDDTERLWYLRAVVRFGWSKLELAKRIADEAHLRIHLTPQEEVYDTENRGTGKANRAESSHIFAVAPFVGFRTQTDERLHPRPKSRGHPGQYRWNFYEMEQPSQNLTNIRNVNCWLTATDALLF